MVERDEASVRLVLAQLLGHGAQRTATASRMRKLHAFLTLTALAATVGMAGAQQFAPTARLHFPVDFVEADRTRLADLDGDGDLDLVGTMRNGGAQDLVRIYRNDGHGRFVADPRFTPFALQTTHVVADFDGDGWLDCACYCSPPILMTGWSFRRNDGTGRLLPWNGPVVPVVANGGPPHL